MTSRLAIAAVSATTLAIVGLVIYLRRKQAKKGIRHWQTSQEGREKERQSRLKAWKPDAPFPENYQPNENTKSLFTNYAKLMGHSIPNDENISARVKQAFDSAIVAFPYRCIFNLSFAESRIVNHPKYTQIRQSLSNLRLIDIGCCMGTEIRQLLVDGIDSRNVLGIDIQPQFIDIGIKLFNDAPSFKDRFVICNLLDDDVVKRTPPLQSFLNNGDVTAIYCGAVYHLLRQRDTHKLTQLVATLLPRGGIYFGSSGGSANEPFTSSTVSQQQGEDDKKGTEKKQDPDEQQYLHSVSSFKEMLEKSGFGNCEVGINEKERRGKKWTSAAFPSNPNRSHLFWFAIKS